MTKLDNLIEQFNEIDKNTFNYNRDYSEFIRQLSELSFIGEIDHNNFYITMLEQIFIFNNNKLQLVTLTDDQREEFYTEGYISDFTQFKIANSLHIFINSEKGYFQIFFQKGFLEKIGSPKDDYGFLYEKSLKNANLSSSFDDSQSLEKTDFVVSNLDNDNIGKDIFEKIIKVFKLSKTNTIDVSNFDLKIHQNMSQYWGNLDRDANIIDDEYQETGRPEIIKIPHSHKKYTVSQDLEIINIINGVGYDEINFESNGLIRQLNDITSAESQFYSIIDYINAEKITPKVHPTANPQYIDYVEKHYLSNKWPMASSEEEYEKQKNELTKYKLSITKFHDSVVIKLEVWEMGLVYIITNVWDRRSIN